MDLVDQIQYHQSICNYGDEKITNLKWKLSEISIFMGHITYEKKRVAMFMEWREYYIWLVEFF